MDEKTIAFYDRSADEMSAIYESVDVSESRFAPLGISHGMTLLDIGCGTGRDLAILAKMGADVWGAEPSCGFREKAMTHHPELRDRILPGSLPDAMESFAGQQFERILATAVLMHLPDETLAGSAATLRRLLAVGGKLMVSYSTRRADIVAGTHRDEGGRLFNLREPESVRDTFEIAGFALEHQQIGGDPMGRPGFEWAKQVYS